MVLTMLAVVAAIGFTGATWADVLYQQAPQDGGTALFSDSMGLLFADDFVWTGTDLTDLTWWGGYANDALPASSDFLVQIFGDNGSGAPLLTPLASFAATGVTGTPTALTGNNLAQDIAIYRFDFALAAPLPLTTGSTYHLAITDTTASLWSWAAGTDGNGVARYAAQTPTVWQPQSAQDFAFRLEGTHGPVIPEPGTVVLIGIGLAGMAVRRASKRSAG
jgi:hypothetical protein